MPRRARWSVIQKAAGNIAGKDRMPFTPDQRRCDSPDVTSIGALTERHRVGV